MEIPRDRLAEARAVAAVLGEKRNARPGTVKGRDFSELLSRPRADRMVLRNGRPIALRLPDYSELDDLVGKDRG